MPLPGVRGDRRWGEKVDGTARHEPVPPLECRHGRKRPRPYDVGHSNQERLCHPVPIWMGGVCRKVRKRRQIPEGVQGRPLAQQGNGVDLSCERAVVVVPFDDLKPAHPRPRSVTVVLDCRPDAGEAPEGALVIAHRHERMSQVVGVLVGPDLDVHRSVPIAELKREIQGLRRVHLHEGSLSLVIDGSQSLVKPASGPQSNTTFRLRHYSDAMTADVASRVQRVQAAMTTAGLDALIVTPSADLRYLTGYAARPLERLTALVLPVSDDPALIAPELERAEAERSPAALAGMQIRTHAETDDAHGMAVASVRSAARVAVNDAMPARHLFGFQQALPASTFCPAGALLSSQRMRKAPDEIASLRQAAAAIDRVHSRMGEFLKVGRTERAIAAQVGAAILDEGHSTVDFVIVGSGPHSASPHHTVADRVVEPGDCVVVDIGGTTTAGYCSDSTRTYLVGGEPPQEFIDLYEVLLDAQRAQCDFATAGVTAEAVDRVGRRIIAEHGYGEHFIHRTGHGIGLETHEEPYIVEGNAQTLEPGMTFSIEPGIYLPGRHGARIEDIVVVTADGVQRLNTTSRQLSVVEG